MNRKEIREIRKRFAPEKENFSHIYGCYVNAAKEIVATMDLPVMTMEQEEREMYMNILKRTLSGALGRNLLQIEFDTDQVGVSDEHTLLQALRMSHLSDENMRQLLYDRIREHLEMEETSYVILLAADSYDVPFKEGSGDWDEDSTDQYDYFVCCVCPVRDSKAALRYYAEERSFRGASTGSLLSAPQIGFLFPTFEDRATNIYSALYYTHSASEIHEEFIEAIFHAPRVPMAPAYQKDAFGEALTEALGGECSLEVVKSVHAQLRERLALHKESHDPEAPEISLDEVDEILMAGGVSDDGIRQFHETCRKTFDDPLTLNPENLIESRKFEVVTPEAKITVDPEQVPAIKMQEIDGRRYLLIPVGEGVTVNGIELGIAPERD
ncbi:MAG: DUF4317 domain-containing protein [Mogibacterium sp.]|nr:DUF4317 domain-containing protein [Mogibacterium sp.]